MQKQRRFSIYFAKCGILNFWSLIRIRKTFWKCLIRIRKCRYIFKCEPRYSTWLILKLYCISGHVTNGTGTSVTNSAFCKINSWIVNVRHRPEQNRVTWETPSSVVFPLLQEPIGVLASYAPHVQMQVWSEQVWLNTTFIARGSRSWDKQAVEI